MTELDVESALRVDLEKCRSAYDQLEHASLSLTEDRDRLRTTVSRIDSVVERMYLPPEFAHFQAELSRILTLEGRDG